jgi:hypothetical protein
MKIKEIDLEILSTLNKYPEIKEDVVELCRMAEANAKKPKLADDAEDIIVKDLNNLGNKILTRWAESRENEETERIEAMAVVNKHGKKK